MESVYPVCKGLETSPLNSPLVSRRSWPCVSPWPSTTSAALSSYGGHFLFTEETPSVHYGLSATGVKDEPSLLPMPKGKTRIGLSRPGYEYYTLFSTIFLHY
jgi:hypothetical protein